MHPNLNMVNQEKLVISKISNIWSSLGYIYEVWFWLSNQWIQLNEK